MVTGKAEPRPFDWMVKRGQPQMGGSIAKIPGSRLQTSLSLAFLLLTWFGQVRGPELYSRYSIQPTQMDTAGIRRGEERGGGRGEDRSKRSGRSVP